MGARAKSGRSWWIRREALCSTARLTSALRQRSWATTSSISCCRRWKCENSSTVRHRFHIWSRGQLLVVNEKKKKISDNWTFPSVLRFRNAEEAALAFHWGGFQSRIPDTELQWRGQNWHPFQDEGVPCSAWIQRWVEDVSSSSQRSFWHAGIWTVRAGENSGDLTNGTDAYVTHWGFPSKSEETFFSAKPTQDQLRTLQGCKVGCPLWICGEILWVQNGRYPLKGRTARKFRVLSQSDQVHRGPTAFCPVSRPKALLSHLSMTDVLYHFPIECSVCVLWPHADVTVLQSWGSPIDRHVPETIRDHSSLQWLTVTTVFFAAFGQQNQFSIWSSAADPGFGEVVLMKDLTHLNICKPESRDSSLYQLTVNFIRSLIPEQEEVQERQTQWKEEAFNFFDIFNPFS